MAFIITTAKTIRNHWKKSTFAALILTYAGNSAQHYLNSQELMREYCRKAAKYGSEPIDVQTNPRNITVILNPSANKRKATDDFDSYCAPLLHLAGICVEVVKTEKEGHAKSLIETLQNTEAIVVAGGDGTLSEVVTGLLRRNAESTDSNVVPIGVLPLGKINQIGKSFFPGENKLDRIRSLADATMAVIEQATKAVDVMKIEVVEDNNEGEENPKPVYAVGGIKWGAYRDAEVKKESYWYFGGLKKYATYLFNGYKNSLSWNCEATVNYSPPCDGCSNCFKRKQDLNRGKSWLHRFVKEDQPNLKYLQINNPECRQIHETKISTSDLALLTSNLLNSNSSKLQLNIGPNNLEYLDFIREGWRSENGERRKVSQVIEARTIEIQPTVASTPQKESYFSIDNENFEVKHIKITLLPKIIQMFCKDEKL